MKQLITTLLCVSALCTSPMTGFYHRPRTSSAPYISGDSFMYMADHVIEDNKHCRPQDRIPNSFDPTKVKAGDIIFVQSDLVRTFFTDHHRQIKQPYLLISHTFLFHNDDEPTQYTTYFNDETLIAWYGKNVPPIHPKLHTLPLGLANAYYPHGNIKMVEIMRKKKPVHAADKKMVYVNFVTANHPDRARARKQFSGKSYCTQAKPTSYKTYLEALRKHRFVASPRGTGVDCHRTWEALLMGSIPIVRTSFLDPLLKQLPVLIIDDWHQISEPMLHEAYTRIQNTSYNTNLLFLDYWISKIKKTVAPYKKGIHK